MKYRAERMRPNLTAANKLSLWVLVGFIAIGNAARVLAIGPADFSRNMLLSEVLYYIFGIGFLVVVKDAEQIVFKVFGIILGVFVTWTAVGIFNYGFELSSIAYGIRMVLIIIASIGLALFAARQGVDLCCSADVLIKGYFFSATIGLVMYFAFPESAAMWEALARYGILFDGDPHQHRLVGLYFDPNFSGSLYSFGTGFSLVRYFQTKRKIFMFIFVFLVAAICMTISRSGFGTLVLAVLLALIIIRRRMSVLQMIVLIGLFLTVATLLFAFGLLNEGQGNGLGGLYDRFRFILYDESAWARYYSWEVGTALFVKHMFCGVGYNFVKMELVAGLGEIDASILFTLCCFGVLGLFLIIFSLIPIYLKITAALRFMRKNSVLNWEIALFAVGFCLASALFTSFFINIVYYIFWLCPIIYFIVLIMAYSPLDRRYIRYGEFE